MRRVLAVLCLNGMVSCSDNESAGSTPLAAMKIEATIQWIDGALHPTVIVTRSGEPVEDGYVSLNDTVLTYDAGRYSCPGVPASIGDEVVLTLATGNRSIDVISQVPDRPVLLSPTAAGSPYLVGAELLVHWNALSPAPQSVNVWVWEGYTSDYATYAAGDSDPIDLYVDGTATWVKLPPYAVATHNAATSPGYANMSLEVRSINAVDLGGLGVDAGSYVHVTSTVESAAFTTE